jgi:4'-phosphopantetheinyl transferase superfamily
MLETGELQRWAELRYRPDRDRLFTGVLLRHVVLNQMAHRDVPVERRCRACGAVDHGEVQPAGVADRARWRTSLSHSETTIMLAVAETDGADIAIDVGVDVESTGRMDPRMARHMLSAAERVRLPNPTRWLLCGIWTMKEAALKALGCGLHASMTDLEVQLSSEQNELAVRTVGDDPRLRPLRDRPARLIDMTDDISGPHQEASRRAALMVIGNADVNLVHHRLTTEELWAAAVPSARRA